MEYAKKLDHWLESREQADKLEAVGSLLDEIDELAGHLATMGDPDDYETRQAWINESLAYQDGITARTKTVRDLIGS